ncbi:MAG: CHAD domain-containing protein [Acidobacteriota bacterium]
MAKAKLVKGINCGDPAVTAITEVLRQRLDEVCTLRERALDYSDPEGVHDMRVSSRRLRSALRDFKPYLQKSRMTRAIKSVRRLADSLGTVRDQDVAIIALEKVMVKMSPDLTAGTQALIAERRGQQKEAQAELTSFISEDNLKRLNTNFTEALNTLTVPGEAPGKRLKSYKVLGRSIVLNRLKELQSLSSSLYGPHKTLPLHEMRIAAKRLRYAVELFAPCWEESLGVFAREVAKLQSSLGELHDCDLWMEYFGARLKRKIKKDAEPIFLQERDAMIWLLGHFTRLRAKHYRAALDRWSEWERKDFITNLTSAVRSSEQ